MNQKSFYIYSHSSVPWQQKIIFDFLTAIPLKKDSWCLDAGCGIGNNIPTLLNFFNNIVACDISEEALEYAKNRFKNYSNITFIRADIRRLPFKDNFFDVVVCTEVFEHLENPETAKEELLRVLKKNDSYLIISVPNYFNLAGVIKMIMDKISGRQSWGVWGDTQKTGEIEKFTTWFFIRKLFSQKNIKIIKERGGDFLNAWFLFLPFVYRNFKLTDKYPFLLLGKLPILNKLGMNYFILGKTKLSQ
jgi:ubiquinone/menaquinone biosynthesis C-methylase UbiE